MPTAARSASSENGFLQVCGGWIGAWFAIAAALAFASSLLIRLFTMPAGWRIAVAALPVPALVALVIAVRRGSSRLDELQRRIQLEAFAVALGVAAIGFLVFGQLQVAGVLGPEDWVFPWLAIFFGYHFGIVIARKRYE